MKPSGSLARLIANAAAVAALAWAFAFAFGQETPTGRLTGVVVRRDSGQPVAGADVYLSPVISDEEEPFVRRTRHAVTGPDGRFALNQVCAGDYTISAITQAHAARGETISVSEEGFTQTMLALNRSEPDLRIAQQRRVLPTGRIVSLHVRGYVDPAKPAHTDTMSVKLYRARLGQVLSDPAAARALGQIGPYNPARELPAALLNPPGGSAPRLVFDRTERIVEDDREGFFDQRVQFGSLPPGLYLAQVRCGANSACDALQVTDLALVVKRAHGQYLAFATDLTSGAPLAGVQIRALRGGKQVCSLNTDARGLAGWNLPPATRNAPGDDGSAPRNSTIVIATRGEDDAVSNGEEYQREGSGRFAIYMQTDRPIYRPGQTIQYKGTVRARRSDGYRYALPAPAPVRVEVRDPGGEMIARTSHSLNAMGSFAGRVDLSPEAPTGIYTILTSIAGEKRTHDVVVASYKKPEFTVTVTPTRRRIVRGEAAEYRVHAEYYFGAPLAGAHVKYSTYATPKWPSDSPDEEDEEYSEEREWRRQRLYGRDYGHDSGSGEAELDERGEALIRIDTRRPPADSGPIDEVLTLYATVKDPAGRETQADGDVQVVQGDLQVRVDPTGYLAAPGTPFDVQVSAMPYDGPPAANRPIELEYGYTRFVRHANRDSDSEWIDFRYERAGVVLGSTGADGRALLRVIPPHAGDLRLTARARDAAGRVVEARTEVYCTAESTDGLDTEYADLAVFTDKKRYAPGETARILINALHIGPTALVTIEGDRILRTLTVPLVRRSTIIQIPVLAEYGPNVYVAACAVHDGKFASTTANLRVEIPQADLRVSIRPDRSAAAGLPRYGPGDPVAYTIVTTTPDGRPAPCELSFGVVDEAIYALREDNPGAIRAVFYPRRSNGVDTDYSFALEMLGDADKAEPQITARRRFPDTAYWAPFVRTDAHGAARVAFRLPDSLTTWRATAIACSAQTAVGFATSKIVSSKDLLVRLETPRTLTQGDRSTFIAAVHNDTATARRALVHLTARGIAVLGPSTVTLTVPPHGAATASYEVRADAPGKSQLRVTAWTPIEPHMPQLTDGLERTLDVLPDGHELREVFAGEVTAARPETETFRFDPSATPGFSRVTIRLLPSIRASLDGALDYLASYPYGCTEQTLSRFVPMLAARRLRQVGLTIPVAPREADMVRDNLTRLYRFQRDKGYWGWWEQDSVDAWMTSYAVYGLARARELGEPISGSALDRGRRSLLSLLPHCTPEEKGFALYALALAGDASDALAARRGIDLAEAPTETLAYVALLDARTGANAAPVLDALMGRAQREGPLLHWTALKNRWGWSEWSDVMTTSAAIRALAAVDPHNPWIPSAMRWLLLQRQGDAWASTRDTAWAVEALASVMERNPGLAAPASGEVRVRLNGTPVQTCALTADAAREPELVVRPSLRLLRPGKNELLLEHSGTGPVFYTVEVRQIVPGPAPVGVTRAPVSIRREWYRLTPSRGQQGLSLVPVATRPEFRAGDRIRVKLILDVRQDMTYVIIREPFPAGCEVNERGSADEAVEWGYWWSGIDVRDDHIAFFAQKLHPGRHEIEYNLTARTPGSYRAAPTTVQSMYDPGSLSNGLAEQVEVRP